MGTHPLSSVAMCRVTGASARQLDYWTRTGMFHPQGFGSGSGTPWRFTAHDAYVARLLVVLHLLGARQDTCRPVTAYFSSLPQPWTGFVLVTTDGFVSALDDLADLEYGWALSLEAITSYVEDRLWAVA